MQSPSALSSSSAVRWQRRVPDPASDPPRPGDLPPRLAPSSTPRRAVPTAAPAPALFALVDVEALVSKDVAVVEQIGLLIVALEPDPSTGRLRCRVVEEHLIVVRQDLTRDELAQQFRIDRYRVDAAIAGYQLVTGDRCYMHADGLQWPDALGFVVNAVRAHGAVVWAKGADLERRVFGRFLEIYDLADYGCPKYPYPRHNPLDECKFFSQYLAHIYSR